METAYTFTILKEQFKNLSQLSLNPFPAIIIFQGAWKGYKMVNRLKQLK